MWSVSCKRYAIWSYDLDDGQWRTLDAQSGKSRQHEKNPKAPKPRGVSVLSECTRRATPDLPDFQGKALKTYTRGSSVVTAGSDLKPLPEPCSLAGGLGTFGNVLELGRWVLSQRPPLQVPCPPPDIRTYL